MKSFTYFQTLINSEDSGFSGIFSKPGLEKGLKLSIALNYALKIRKPVKLKPGAP